MSIVVHHVSKIFGIDQTKALDDVSFRIEQGEFIALTGRSGSGKSTMLYVLSTLDSPTLGTVEINGLDSAKMKKTVRHRFRNLEIGFVFQFHYLLPELTALENVLMPAVKAKQYQQRLPRARMLLEHFDLGGKINRLATQLSGGEQQRVAIARALIMEPKYLFADEPTGNLDTVNGEIVMKILQKANREQNMTVVLVTHETDFAALADRQIKLIDGHIASANS